MGFATARHDAVGGYAHAQDRGLAQEFPARGILQGLGGAGRSPMPEAPGQGGQAPHDQIEDRDHLEVGPGPGQGSEPRQPPRGPGQADPHVQRQRQMDEHQYGGDPAIRALRQQPVQELPVVDLQDDDKENEK